MGGRDEIFFFLTVKGLQKCGGRQSRELKWSRTYTSVDRDLDVQWKEAALPTVAGICRKWRKKVILGWGELMRTECMKGE